MEIIHATWEKRNLDVDCYEILVGSEDSIDDLKKVLLNFDVEYMVVKVPMGRIDINMFLQMSGFFFVELITTCHRPNALPSMTPIEKKMVNAVSCQNMSQEDLVYLFTQIQAGLLRDDRVSLDQGFTREQSNNRYIGWIKDEIAKGATFFQLTYRGKRLGFFNLRQLVGGIFSANIGGIYVEFQKAGFGFCLNYFEILEGVKRNAKKIVTSFSSNNRGASAIHFKIGYTLDSQFYVFTKHK